MQIIFASNVEFKQKVERDKIQMKEFQEIQEMTAKNLRQLEENIKNELQAYVPANIFKEEITTRAKLADIEKLRGEVKVFAKENEM